MGNPNWVKGISGNPSGKHRVLPRELVEQLENNKALFKQLVLQYFNLTQSQIDERSRQKDRPFIEVLLQKCFEKTANDGNVDAFVKLLTLVFGKMPEESIDFEITEEERQFIMALRERRANGIIGNSTPDAGRNNASGLQTKI